MRLGYYKLTRAKEQGSDWGWIVAHGVQTGPEKCLLIVGLKLSAGPAVGESRTPADVEPRAVYPVTQSNGESVSQQLEEARQQTGVPREILSDQGSDLPKGIPQFCHAPPETCFIYDIKHQVAALLKRELGADPTWQACRRLAGQTPQRVQQTALAALAPPRPRRKARYMNGGELVDWSVRMLRYLAEGGGHRPEWGLPRVDQEGGWVRQYRQEGEQGRQWGAVGTLVEQGVKTHGLSPRSAQQLPHRLAGGGERSLGRSRWVRS